MHHMFMVMANLHTHTHIHYTHTHTHTYINACTHIHTQTQTHTHAHTTGSTRHRASDCGLPSARGEEASAEEAFCYPSAALQWAGWWLKGVPGGRAPDRMVTRYMVTSFGGGDSRHFGPMCLLFLNWFRECFAACVVFLFFYMVWCIRWCTVYMACIWCCVWYDAYDGVHGMHMMLCMVWCIRWCTWHAYDAVYGMMHTMVYMACIWCCVWYDAYEGVHGMRLMLCTLWCIRQYVYGSMCTYTAVCMMYGMMHTTVYM